MLSTNYISCSERFYRRSYDGIHLLYVTAKEAQQIIEEFHESSYGPHMNAHMLSRKIIMEANCATHVQKCHHCQVHGDLKHMPFMPLHTMTSPWPFSTWGIDIIGKIHSIASNGYEFIVVAIDYFTKWVEASSYKILNLKKVAQFIQTNIIYRYRELHELSLIMGNTSKEKQRSYYDSSTFNTTSLHLTVLKTLEQLRLLIKT